MTHSENIISSALGTFLGLTYVPLHLIGHGCILCNKTIILNKALSLSVSKKLLNWSGKQWEPSNFFAVGQKCRWPGNSELAAGV